MDLAPVPRLIKALLRQPTDMTPVWLMRQAGRYLPEYRALRNKIKDFVTLCKTPDLACEITLQPIRRFPLDAAILFSDILTIPDAMGLGLYFQEHEGPRFLNPLKTSDDIKHLTVPDSDDLEYVFAALRLVKQELAGKAPVIGFAGSPWTLAVYMLENAITKDFRKIKRWLYQDPLSLHHLLDILAQAVTLYLNQQIMAGADAVMIFDSWGGILTTSAYREFSLAYINKIISGLQRQLSGKIIPVIVFSKQGDRLLEELAATGVDAIGLDWTIDIAGARNRVGAKVALQGNLDPAILYAPDERLHQEVANILRGYGHGSGHIFNLGHGVPQDVDPEKIATLIASVKDLSRAYHQ